MNEQQQQAQDWLANLLQLMGIPAEVEGIETPEQDESCWLKIVEQALTPDQTEILLGTEGKTLDALQYLTNTILNVGVEREAQQPYTLELGDYRLRRHQLLMQQVETAIATVREQGVEFEMPPLSSAERRKVHNFFTELTDLDTESRGSEPHRRIFVFPSTAAE